MIVRSAAGAHPNVGTPLSKSHPAVTGTSEEASIVYIQKKEKKKKHRVNEVKTSDMAESTNSLIAEYMLLLSYECSSLN